MSMNLLTFLVFLTIGLVLNAMYITNWVVYPCYFISGWFLAEWLREYFPR